MPCSLPDPLTDKSLPAARIALLEARLKCPRCGSNSVLSNHQTVACVACGHVLDEPPREVRDAAWFSAGSGYHLGPLLTPTERLGFKTDRPGKPQPKI